MKSSNEKETPSARSIFGVIVVVGFNAGFFTLAGIAVVGLCFYGMLIPETKNRTTT